MTDGHYLDFNIDSSIMIVLFRTTDLSDVNNVQRIKEVLKSAPSRDIVLLSSRNPSYVIDMLNDTFTRVGFKSIWLHYSQLLKISKIG